MEVYSHVYTGAQGATTITMDAPLPDCACQGQKTAAPVVRLVNIWRHGGLTQVRQPFSFSAL